MTTIIHNDAGTAFHHGRPCKHCGATLRYASTYHCVACHVPNMAAAVTARRRCLAAAKRRQSPPTRGL